jgi:hypothetical protein
MKKPSGKEIDEHVAEKRGWHWALTSFVVEVWGQSEEEMRQVKRG